MNPQRLLSIPKAIYKKIFLAKADSRLLRQHLSIFSHTTIEERLCIHKCASRLHDNCRVLEIGSHLGSSALLIAHAIKRKKGKLYCVDTWDNATMPDGMKDTFDDFRLNTSIYEDVIIPIRKSSHDLSLGDVEAGIEMAFIDGDHSEQGVRNDFLKIKAVLKSDGLALFHDLTHFHGVNKVVGEAMSSGEWQLLELVNSLAVLKRIPNREVQ